MVLAKQTAETSRHRRFIVEIEKKEEKVKEKGKKPYKRICSTSKLNLQVAITTLQ